MKKLKILMFFLLAGISAWAQDKLTEYEYWFNNDYANREVVAFTSNTTQSLDTDFDVSSLPLGVNILNMRFKDEKGKYSCILSKSFVKINEQNSIQNKLVAYEYWFNNDYANKQVIALSSNTTQSLDTDFDVSSLPLGVNILNMRFKDEKGKYSCITSKSFLRVNKPNSLQNKLIEYEYWFNNEYANKHVIALSTNTTQSLNTDFDVSSLPSGLNVFNIRYKDENGKLSSVLSKVFVKRAQSLLGNKIVDYRYWFDNDIDNAVNIQLYPTQQVNLVENLNLAQLPEGNHEVNFQFKDSFGVWSVVLVQNIERISVGVVENTFNTNIGVYPNPTDGFVTIHFGEIQESFSVTVTDLTGKEISMSIFSSTDKIEMNLNVQPGIYFLTIKLHEKIAKFKLIKK